MHGEENQHLQAQRRKRANLRNKIMPTCRDLLPRVISFGKSDDTCFVSKLAQSHSNGEGTASKSAGAQSREVTQQTFASFTTTTTMTSTILNTRSSSSAMLRMAAVLVLASQLPLGVFARHCWIDKCVQCPHLSIHQY